MSKNNQVQVVDVQEKNGTRIIKGNRTVEFSPEVSEYICEDMVKLGIQLISETGKVTIEYFKTQANMYYEELNAYISNQTLKSEERKMILSSINKLTDKYVELINETDDIQKREQLKSAYEFFTEKHAKLYMDALGTDSTTKMPPKTNLLSGLYRLFFKKPDL